ncbi:MAG: FmdB family zinc ribbon protein [Aureliella sp.]
MPLYEFHCERCDHDVEVLLRSSSEKPTCPDCGSDSLEKLLSVPAAPSIASGSLPVCGPSDPGTCGRPQCGSGRCMFGE